MKFRTFEGDNTSVAGETPEPVDDDPIRQVCMDIKRTLEHKGKLVTKSSMKSQVVKEIKAGFINESLRPDLIRYIEKHCPEELD